MIAHSIFSFIIIIETIVINYVIVNGSRCSSHTGWHQFLLWFSRWVLLRNFWVFFKSLLRISVISRLIRQHLSSLICTLFSNQLRIIKIFTTRLRSRNLLWWCFDLIERYLRGMGVQGWLSSSLWATTFGCYLGLVCFLHIFTGFICFCLCHILLSSLSSRNNICFTGTCLNWFCCFWLGPLIAHLYRLFSSWKRWLRLSYWLCRYSCCCYCFCHCCCLIRSASSSQLLGLIG